MDNLKDKIKKAYDLHSNGQLIEAEAIYQDILHIDKKNTEVNYLLGLVKFELGKLNEAYKLVKKVSENNPPRDDYFYNLALISTKMGKKTEALSFSKRAINLSPKNSSAYTIYAECLKGMGRIQEAIKAYEEAERIEKVFSEDIIINQGLLLTELEEYLSAESKFKKVLKINPDSIDATLGIAKIHLYKKKYTKAITLLDKLSNTYKNNKKIEILRAESYLRNNKLNKALSINKEIIKKYKNDLSILNNIGYILRGMENYDEAKKYFKKIISVDPEHINANVNLGLVLLAEKSFKKGWKHYEFRNYQESMKKNRPRTNSKLWDNEILNNKKVLAWTEQGLGDEILQAGLINDLNNYVSKLTLLCSERLLTIFKRSFPNVDILSKDNPDLSSRNFQNYISCPILDTSKFLRTNDSEFLNNNQYLIPDNNKVETLKQKYLNLVSNDHGDPIIIGLSWRSENKQYGEQNTIKLLNWKPFFEIIKNSKRKIVILSTQYNSQEEELRDVYNYFGIKIHIDKEIQYSKDLDGPISQIASCDFLISTSTTTAQIAGALGKRIWHLPSNGISCGWYWLNKGERTPWYPKMIQIRRKGNDTNAQLRELSIKLSKYI